jgi:gas vesicle protein
MNPNIFLLGTIVGFIIGTFATLFVMLGAPSGLYSRTQIAIGECERSLPRDQHCKIIAVIDKE